MAKSLLLVFLLPPMNLAVLALVGVILAHWRPRLGRGIALLATIGLLVLALPVVSGAMLGGLERDLPIAPPDNAPPQAIVVLGGDTKRTTSVTDGIVVGNLTLERLRTAAALARRTGLPLLVTGGRAVDEALPVGTLMATSLTEDFGLPVRWTEARSRDTWENARFSAPMLHEAGIRSVYVVTHAWHMRRALIAFAGTGLVVTAAPTPLQWPATPLVGDFIPRVSSWLTVYFAMHEWIGMLWYEYR